LAVVLVWGLVVMATRRVSAASLAAAAMAPVLYLLGDKLAWYVDKSWLLAIFAMSLVLAVRHWGNIERLLAGTEPKLGAGKAAAVAAEKSGPEQRAAGAASARQGRKKA
jgi:acyl phosphate:glycerol-3-phosphate acyltransferase